MSAMVPPVEVTDGVRQVAQRQAAPERRMQNSAAQRGSSRPMSQSDSANASGNSGTTTSQPGIDCGGAAPGCTLSPSRPPHPVRARSIPLNNKKQWGLSMAGPDGNCQPDLGREGVV